MNLRRGAQRGHFDLSEGFSYGFFSYQGIEHAGIIIWSTIEPGEEGSYVAVCAPWFDTPEVRATPPTSEPDKRNFWKIENQDPLTLSPSIQMYRLVDGGGDEAKQVPSHHGFVREGRWVWA